MTYISLADGRQEGYNHFGKWLAIWQSCTKIGQWSVVIFKSGGTINWRILAEACDFDYYTEKGWEGGQYV